MLIGIAMAVALASGALPGAHIGVAVAPGTFELDRATVSGNGTIFEGSSVRAGATAADIRLTTGTRIRLGSGAEAAIYRDRLVLSHGAARVEAGPGYAVESLGLRLLPERGVAALNGGSRIEVAALGAPVQVKTSAGLAVATIAAGTALALEQAAQGAAAAPEKLTGVLRLEKGHYLLTDQTTKTTVELAGSNLNAHVGTRVSVTGTIDTSTQAVQGAAHVVRVASISAAAAGGVSGAVVGGVLAATAGTAATVAVVSTRDNESSNLSR